MTPLAPFRPCDRPLLGRCGFCSRGRSSFLGASCSTAPGPTSAPSPDGAPGRFERRPLEASVPLDAPSIPLDVSPLEPCNGSPSFCDVAYDQLTLPDRARRGWPMWNPPLRLHRAGRVSAARPARRRGIRVLELTAHALGAASDASTDAGGGNLVLCNGDCAAGSSPLEGTLGAVQSFFAVNPREVVTLLVEGGVRRRRSRERLRDRGARHTRARRVRRWGHRGPRCGR